MKRSIGIAVSAAGIVCTLTSCSKTVAIPIPDPTDPAVIQECTALNAALPSSVSYQVRQNTEPQSPLTAAWGNPAITLRCGVQQPAGLQPTSQLLTVNEVDWLDEQRSAGYVFTTVGRAAYIEVAVPSQYSPETNVLVDLADAIKRTIPAVK